MIQLDFPTNQVKALTVREFCREMSIGKTLFYEQVKSKKIRILKIGRKTLVPMSELFRLMDAST